MNSNTKRSSERQSDANLPLLNWRPLIVHPRPHTMAGSFVARRYRVDPAVADLIAAAAGLGSEVRS
jgi:hypothetical protein